MCIKQMCNASMHFNVKTISSMSSISTSTCRKDNTNLKYRHNNCGVSRWWNDIDAISTQSINVQSTDVRMSFIMSTLGNWYQYDIVDIVDNNTTSCLTKPNIFHIQCRITFFMVYSSQINPNGYQHRYLFTTLVSRVFKQFCTFVKLYSFSI